MSDFSESYLEDDCDEISSVETEGPSKGIGGVIAIGIITPRRKKLDKNPKRRKSKTSLRKRNFDSTK